LTDKIKINISSSKIVRLLGIIIIVLSAAHVIGQLTKYLTSHDFVFGLISEFNVDAESNVPTYFSSLMLLMASILLGIIAIYKNKTKGSFILHWSVLSIIFFILSLEEIVGFHERLSAILGRTRWEYTGYFHYAWTIPGLIVVCIFVALYFKFWMNLPQKTRLLFLISGLLYVGGAIGFELISGTYADMHGINNLASGMIAAVEELLEMSGCLCFIYTLFQYIEEHIQNIEICFADKENV